MILSVILLFALSSVSCNDENGKFKDDEINILKRSEVQISLENNSKGICNGVMLSPSIILTGLQLK